MIWTLRSGWIDFSNTGEIGDTIGGLTAPVIGIIGAWLVFLSFREQWITNQIQYREIRNFRHFDILEKRVSNLHESFPKAYHKGLLPILRHASLEPDRQKSFKDVLMNNSSIISRAYFVMQEFIQIDNQIENNEDLTEDQATYLKDQLFIIIIYNLSDKEYDESTQVLLQYFDQETAKGDSHRFLIKLELAITNFITVRTKYYSEYIS